MFSAQQLSCMLTKFLNFNSVSMRCNTMLTSSLAAIMQADTHVVLEQLNVWCQCMHGAGGIVAG